MRCRFIGPECFPCSLSTGSQTLCGARFAKVILMRNQCGPVPQKSLQWSTDRGWTTASSLLEYLDNFLSEHLDMNSLLE